MALNGLIVEIINAFTANKISLLFDRLDIYADLIKTSLSLNHIVGEVALIPGFNNWPVEIKTYALHNPYKDFDPLFPSLSIFHHTPLTFNYFQIFSFFLVKGINPLHLVLLNIILLCLFFLKIINICKKIYSFNSEKLIFVMLNLFIGYPTLCIVNRGNFQSGYSSVFFILGILLYFEKNILSKFFLSLSLNIRPNLFLALLTLLNKKNNPFHLLIELVLIFSAILLCAYFFAINISSNYNIDNFYQALKIYNDLYIVGPHGNGANSSLHSLAKLLSLFFLNFKYNFSLLCFIYLIFFFKYIKSNKVSYASNVYFGCCMTMLFTPVFADYHLLIFITPLILAIFESEKNEKNSYIISISSLCIMSAKFGICFAGFSLGTVLNPLVVLISFTFTLNNNNK